MKDPLLAPTPLLDFEHPGLAALVARRGWAALSHHDRIGAVYRFVRDEIAFGYNRDDAMPASAVWREGRGQCNTKAILLMALLRALGVRCRLHGFTIDKSLQRGIVPEAVYFLAPPEIVHSWVEIEAGGRWIDLEGFILDAPLLAALQRRFPDRQRLCGYGAGTDRLQAPPVDWRGDSTYIQASAIVRDLGVHDSPDAFYAGHSQRFGPVRGGFYRHVVRHWMNARVMKIRAGRVPAIPGDGIPASAASAPGRLQSSTPACAKASNVQSLR